MMMDVVTTKRRGVTSNLLAAFGPILVSLPLCFTAGCIADTEEDATATKTQGLGASCSLQRPYQWDGTVTTCKESQSITTTLIMQDGEVYFTESAPHVGYGTGWANVICDNGTPKKGSSVCKPNITLPDR